MHTLRITIGGALALALSGLSIVCAYKFGRHLGGSGDEGLIYGALGGLADAFKAILPMAIAAALATRQRVRAGVAVLLFLTFSIYSFCSEIGLYALARSSQTGDVEVVKAKYGELRGELSTIRERLKTLGQQRPSGTIKAELSAKRQIKYWELSAQCTAADTYIARTYCGEYEKFSAELSTAEEAERLRARDRELSTKLEGIDLGTAIRSTDPQAEAFSRFTGFSSETIRDAFAVLIAVLLELGSGLGLWAATATGAPSGGRKDLPAAPAVLEAPVRPVARPRVLACTDGVSMKSEPMPDPVKRFLRDCTSKAPGVETAARELLDAFTAWAKDEGADELNPVALGRRFSALGLERTKRNGCAHYSGIRLTA